MTWESIDFHGIIQFDQMLVEQLEQFLQEKESRLSEQILLLIPSTPPEAPTLSPPSTGGMMKLSGVIEGFTKKVKASAEAKGGTVSFPSPKKKIIHEINAILWEFTEILEGCVVELFQQIKQIPIDSWRLSNFNVAGMIKDLLIHSIDDLIWVVRRLENPLKEYCQGYSIEGVKRWPRWIPFGEEYLDGNLLKNLEKTEKFLKESYDAFKNQFDGYSDLNGKAEMLIEEVRNYPVFALLNMSDQQVYLELFRLLKLLEISPRLKKEMGEEIGRALKYRVSIDQALQVFHLYFEDVQAAFFRCSLEWKTLNREDAGFEKSLKKLQDIARDMQEELRSFIHTMGAYRTFILRNDPNPYVRSRWGFSEWIVGPEPANAKAIASLIYMADELIEDTKHFAGALETNQVEKEKRCEEAHVIIDKLLHEMGQPLISQSMMKRRSEELLEMLRECDEVGSCHLSTIFYVEDVLSKAMRQDWKYHVLHEIPLFHRIYRLHQGFVEQFDDPSHAFRLERFQTLLDQIQEWMEKGKIQAYAPEMDLDLNDLKTYLQDFLAGVQRAAKEKSDNPFLNETIHKLQQQLIEYRYLFGHFFAFLRSKGQQGGGQLRNRLLFVDQYFESVENLLNELK